MKRLIALTVVFMLMLFALIGCNDTQSEQSEQSTQSDASTESSESSEDLQEILWNPEELDYIDGLFAAEMIDYEDISKYDKCYRYVSDEEYSITPILFIPKTAIYDVKIFSISEDWVISDDKVIENILYETEKVTDTKPLLADIKFVDAFPVNGISFTDENGNEHFYEISDSPVDGSLLINKFENADPDQSEEASTPETSESETSEPENGDNSGSAVLEYIDGLFAAEMLSYNDIEKYGECIRFTDNDHSITPILFTPKTEIFNVKIFSITDDWVDISDKKIESILFEAESVTAEKPLIADIKFVDIFAVRGISFTDENGNEHFYEISDSPADGRLLINKFENADPDQSEEASTHETSESENSENSIFSTANLTRITFYSYYGMGTGCEVPSENMAEIKAWLASFTVGEEIIGLVPPGTNTVYVELEYSDGRVINQGLDTVEIDGVGYYTERGKAPDCYYDILSRTSLE